MAQRMVLLVQPAVHTRQPTGPLFDVLLLVHVACALAGVASVVVSAVFAARIGGAPATAAPAGGNGTSDVLWRYYAPGTNWVGRLLYGVPVLGIALVEASGGYASFADGWVLGGVVLWVSAIALGEGVVWPGEQRIQEAIRSTGTPTGTPTGPGSADRAPRDALVVARRSVLAGSGAMFALLVAGFVVMVARP